MSNPVLHIKDSYYFEIPKGLLTRNWKDKEEFPDLWVRNDDQFQNWEATRLYGKLKGMAHGVDLPSEHDLIHEWQHWQHEGTDHANFGHPLDSYLEQHATRLKSAYDTKVADIKAKDPDAKIPAYDDFLKDLAEHGEHFTWVVKVLGADPAKNTNWKSAKEYAGGSSAVAEFKGDESISWSEAKLSHYNAHMSGKILLDPQPFGTLRNFYEAESGFCISKFMVLEVVIAVLLFGFFTFVASKFRTGLAPKGRIWNLFEVFLLFIRDQIARPAIGGGHHEEHGDDHGHGHDDHGHGNHAHAAAHVNEGDRFVPLLWTIFFFVLTCNLFGLIPWLGAPTGSFGTTIGLALITFSTVVICGMLKFGFAGFFLNQVPSMDLPLPLAILLKPMIFAIEMLGLLIKHLVLSIRLLANMVAGHLVILGIMGLAFGAEAAIGFSAPDVPAWQWPFVATIAVVGATLFNVLELFVAFLQAYIFTFLSALFIGASVHKH